MENDLLKGVTVRGNPLEEIMDLNTELFWDEEIPAENDERIQELENDLIEAKKKLAYLSRISSQEDLY